MDDIFVTVAIGPEDFLDDLLAGDVGLGEHKPIALGIRDEKAVFERDQ